MHFSSLPKIRESSDNKYVRIARQAINQWIYENNAGDDLLSSNRTDFNATVTCYTKGFQARHVDSTGKALSVDGVIGSNTWYALGDYSESIDNRIVEEFALTGLGEASDIVAEPPPNIDGVSEIVEHALRIAIQEIGVKEEPLRSNSGPRVEKYQSEGPSDNPSSGQPWCASFVSWCFYRAADKRAEAMPFHYSASSRRIEEELRLAGKFTDIDTNLVLATVRPGDILVWFRCGDMNPESGHIGLVHHYDSATGFLYTIEGNRSHRVWAGKYAYDENSFRLIAGLIGFGRV